MRSRNISLGCGFQSVQGCGANSILRDQKADHLIKRSPPDPKFTFNANFCESNLHLQRELSEAFGASSNLGPACMEVQAIFNKVSTNSNNVSYCVITLQWEKFRKFLDLTDPNNFIDLEHELENPERFYRSYGDNVITQVVYGEKLLVIIQIDKTSQSISLEHGVGANVKAPYLGGKVSLAEVLRKSQSSSISNIHIYSIGNDTPNQQTAVISDVKLIKDKIEQLLNNERQHSHENSDFVTRKEIIELKNILTKKLDDINHVLQESLHLTFNNRFKHALHEQQKNSEAQNSYAVISFTVSSYLCLIPKDRDQAIKHQYDFLLRSTARACHYIKALNKCSNRAQLYLEHIEYALKNEPAMNIDDTSRDELIIHQEFLSKMCENLRRNEQLVTENIFSDSIRYHNGTTKSWLDKWHDIKYFSELLNNLSSLVIDYLSSAFCIGEIKSKYSYKDYSRWNFINKRCSDYVKLIIPAQATQLRFNVIHGPREMKQQLQLQKNDTISTLTSSLNENQTPFLPSSKGITRGSTDPGKYRRPVQSPLRASSPLTLTLQKLDKPRLISVATPPKEITFNLIRKNKILLNEHTRPHRLLHEKIRNNSKQEPLVLDRSNMIAKLAKNTALPPGKIAKTFFPEIYGTKIYKNVAISAPVCKNFTPEKDCFFTVLIYITTNEPNVPLKFSAIPPDNHINYLPYTFPIDGVDLQKTESESSAYSQTNSPMSLPQTIRRVGTHQSNHAKNTPLHSSGLNQTPALSRNQTVPTLPLPHTTFFDMKQASSATRVSSFEEEKEEVVTQSSQNFY